MNTPPLLSSTKLGGPYTNSIEDQNPTNSPIIVNSERLKSGDLSLSKQDSNIIRLVQQNSNPSINWQEKGITLNNAIESLTKDTKFNPEMKNTVLACIGGATNNTDKLAILSKGLVFLTTEQTLSKLVNDKKLSLEEARETLTKCLEFGCQNDFSLENLNKFNAFLENPQDKNIKEKLNELFSHSDVAKESISKPKEVERVPQSNTCQTTEKTDTVQDAFDVLGKYSWKNKTTAINDTIQNLVNKNNRSYDKKLLDNIQKTLEKTFGVDKKTFNAAWATAISTTQGGEEIKNGPVSLNFGEKEVKMQMTFTPQVNMSGFTKTKTEAPEAPKMKHCSSVYQSATVGDTEHAVNLWRQDIEVNGQKMQFLRHGYILEQDMAAKEILANACFLQYGDEMFNTKKNEPLSLKFSNIQLMSFGTMADKDKPWKQMEMFKNLAQTNPLQITYNNQTVKVKIETPLLFNFGVNAQHFRHLEIGNLKAKKSVEEQNLASFKQLFGDNFPNLEENQFGDGLIQKKLSKLQADDPKKQQIQTLTNQILKIYQSHPEGLKKNPYALPTRVLALTNLLGYASSFNCKSGKDRTGVCSMELSNLCAQMMANQDITDPMQPISDEERNNLQAIYKEGSCVRDIPKINTALQTGLKIGANWLLKYTNDRFGVDLTTSFENNLEKLNPNTKVETGEESSQVMTEEMQEHFAQVITPEASMNGVNHNSKRQPTETNW